MTVFYVEHRLRGTIGAHVSAPYATIAEAKAEAAEIERAEWHRLLGVTVRACTPAEYRAVAPWWWQRGQAGPGLSRMDLEHAQHVGDFAEAAELSEEAAACREVRDALKAGRLRIVEVAS